MQLILHDPTCVLADHFSECVESHAFETYDKFIKAQGGTRVDLENDKLCVLHVYTF